MTDHDVLCDRKDKDPFRQCQPCRYYRAARAHEGEQIACEIESVPERDDLLGALLRSELHQSVRDAFAVAAEIARNRVDR